MSLSDVYRKRYYEPGYVYVAGSFSTRLIKIGTTQEISVYQDRLRRKGYGGIHDWTFLYYIWVDQAGKVEHDARHSLPRLVRYYLKDGSWQRGREIVQCSFAAAFDALATRVCPRVHSGWKSTRCNEFDGVIDTSGELTSESTVAPLGPEVSPFNPAFYAVVAELELSVRSANCLKNENLTYVGDLVRLSEAQLLRTPNFGRKSLNEIKSVLAERGLTLATNIRDWPLPTVGKLARCLDAPFFRTIDQLSAPMWTGRCLKHAGVVYIGDLVQKTEPQLLAASFFCGPKAVNAIKQVLSSMGLSLGMEIPGPFFIDQEA